MNNRLVFRILFLFQDRNSMYMIYQIVLLFLKEMVCEKNHHCRILTLNSAKKFQIPLLKIVTNAKAFNLE